jgi:hypothetical protein
MSESPWETISGFRSPGEFRRFVEWMREQMKAGVAREVPVAAPYAGAATFEERWFEHSESGKTWRLVSPEPPFDGVFEPV